MNFDAPPSTYCSSRSRTRLGGPNAVHCASVASSTRLRGTNGAASGRRARGIVVETVVEEHAEVIGGHLAAGFRRERLRLLDALAPLARA